MSFFPNARKFAINNGSFTNVEGDINYNFHTNPGMREETEYSGLKIIYENSVQGALYNSEQRFPPPNCHPGTRTQVLEILRHWINDVASATSIYWLYGAAGVGKSAVAQTISEEFLASHLAASFFFARADPSRNELSSFFITISYQLATSSELGPLLKYPIDLAVRDNPGIIHAALEQQFQELIVSPCNWLTVTCRLTAEQWKDLPRLIVIDGLDECIQIASQERLLSIIRKAKSATPPLPFEFLICSRPEPRIRNAFRHQDFHPILDCTDIGESFESGKDIAHYLRDEFDRIRQEHGQSMAHLAKDWPGTDIIQQLVHKACGQFIYAATVIKYVGDHDGFPIERLEIILKITVPDDFDSPYPDLDLLYMQILSVCNQRELLLEVMAHILNPAIFLDKRYEQTSSAIIEGLFFLVKGKVWALLSRLHSVLFIPENDHDNITVRHASFFDFLTDPKRSGSYFVNINEEVRHEQVLLCLLKRVSTCIINHSKDDAAFVESEFDDYAWNSWAAHFQKIGESSDSRIITAMNQLDLCGLLNTMSRRKNISLKLYVDMLRGYLDNFGIVAQWAHALRQSTHLPIFDTLVKQYRSFEYGFRIVIPPSLGPLSSEALMTTISVLKNNLCLYNQGNYRLEVILCTLHPRGNITEVRKILHSPSLRLSILPFNTDPSQVGLDSVVADTVIIDFAECHKDIGLQCLGIISRRSNLPDVVLYVQNHWINHILETRPSSEILQVVLDNVAMLPSNEDIKKVLEWVEGADVEDKAARQLVKRIQKLLKGANVDHLKAEVRVKVSWIDEKLRRLIRK